MDAIELAGALLSAWGVWLTARRRLLCWPVNLAAVAVYGYVFLAARLYSDALLQGAFAVFIGYGWWRWRQHLGGDGRVQVAPLPPRQAAWHALLGALGALALGAAMHRWTDAALPWLDAALTAFSLVAQWWQARRHIAAWWLWIVVDTVYVGEYVYKSLLITAVLYAGFIALAAMGWRAWRQATAPAAVTAP
ncbi:nicotinamide riboside transporter PnuC [Frateuria defendens]|uniref:nicotinamide riboside transporter PnuC n=1 Tax=Frateuria defendens TaxID=2219559 RepID=UPI00066FD91B|nr:nicotinamide riboside transporter PnuC [Frateuria defendens]